MTVIERVRAGATLLDVSVPGWAGKIDGDRLKMVDCHRCVLGQLFYLFTRGLDELDIPSTSKAAAFGFHHENMDRAQPEWSESVDLEYAALRLCWLAEIAARLTPEPSTEGAAHAHDHAV